MNVNVNSAQLQPHQLASVQAALNYLVPTTERPRTYTHEPPPGEPGSTVVSEAHVLPIHDLRPVASTVSLDREGFGLIRHASAVKNFWDDEEVRAVYYPEVENALKQATGAGRVFIFDHTTRRRIPGAGDGRTGIRQPVPRVHVDHTAKSGPQRVRDLIPDEAEELLKGRVQVINLWRPIRGPLQDYPLAVCEAGSVAFQDLVPSDLVYPHRVGETYQVLHNPAHRWYYVPDMQPDEALLLKCFDSKTDGRARFAPHSAFSDPTAPPDAAPRESIEVRTLVFHRH
jgi:hypothetical protein